MIVLLYLRNKNSRIETSDRPAKDNVIKIQLLFILILIDISRISSPLINFRGLAIDTPTVWRFPQEDEKRREAHRGEQVQDAPQ